MANMEVLDKAIAAIRAHPDNHDQDSWAWTPDGSDLVVTGDPAPQCGTTLCMAGWITWQNAPEGSVMDSTWYRERPDDPNRLSAKLIPKFAQKTAELTDSQAEALFFVAETELHLEVMVEMLRRDDKATESNLRAAADLIPESD